MRQVSLSGAVDMLFRFPYMPEWFGEVSETRNAFERGFCLFGSHRLQVSQISDDEVGRRSFG